MGNRVTFWWIVGMGLAPSSRLPATISLAKPASYATRLWMGQAGLREEDGASAPDFDPSWGLRFLVAMR